MDNINNQGVKDLFSDILFEASNLTRCEAISTVAESHLKRDVLDTEELNDGKLENL